MEWYFYWISRFVCQIKIRIKSIHADLCILNTAMTIFKVKVTCQSWKFSIDQCFIEINVSRFLLSHWIMHHIDCKMFWMRTIWIWRIFRGRCYFKIVILWKPIITCQVKSNYSSNIAKLWIFLGCKKSIFEKNFKIIKTKNVIWFKLNFRYSRNN